MNGRDEFFVGYLKAPPRLAAFCLSIAAGCVALMAMFSLTLGRSAFEAGSGDYAGEMSVTGVMLSDPYPVLLTAVDAAHPRGRAIMLAGDGKRGVQAIASDLRGKTVTATGVMLKRGDLDMLVVAGDDGLKLQGSAASPGPQIEPLGRWRISGEICDGKCATGAMHPGSGLAHKACANLCIGGGVPPVFASATPVENASFFLLADAKGKAAPATMLDLVGLPVVLEGDLLRIGDLTILRADWSKALVQ